MHHFSNATSKIFQKNKNKFKTTQNSHKILFCLENKINTRFARKAFVTFIAVIKIRPTLERKANAFT